MSATVLFSSISNGNFPLDKLHYSIVRADKQRQRSRISGLALLLYHSSARMERGLLLLPLVSRVDGVNGQCKAEAMVVLCDDNQARKGREKDTQ